MGETVAIDSYKLAYWMNVRKLTPSHLSVALDVHPSAIEDLVRSAQSDLPEGVCDRLSAALRVAPSQITRSAGRTPTVIAMSATQVSATRRSIQRDGIHFYNYYSMAGPPGRVAPVILDVLCPAERVPALNNGHLEPAITINLGPGDIHGRWGKELAADTWHVLAANDGEDAWIAGDSYVEPSYCPHAYSLVSEQPARIISYTSESNLASLLSDINSWTDPAFNALLDRLGDCGPGRMLAAMLARRGFEVPDAARVAGVPESRLREFLSGDATTLALEELWRLGDALGLDYRVLLPPVACHDSVGKSCCSIDESRATARRFCSYSVASTAVAPHLPDLVGLFMRVTRPSTGDGGLDLCDNAESHYLVTDGELMLTWRDAAGERQIVGLTPDATAWVAPFVEHAWLGDGAVIKLSSGRHVGYLDQIELSNTFAAEATLKRGRCSTLGWGYDSQNES